MFYYIHAYDKSFLALSLSFRNKDISLTYCKTKCRLCNSAYIYSSKNFYNKITSANKESYNADSENLNCKCRHRKPSIKFKKVKLSK